MVSALILSMDDSCPVTPESSLDLKYGELRTGTYRQCLSEIRVVHDVLGLSEVVALGALVRLKGGAQEIRISRILGAGGQFSLTCRRYVLHDRRPGCQFVLLTLLLRQN